MAGPWEKYQAAEGPWEKYKTPLTGEALQEQRTGAVARGVPVLGAYEPQASAAIKSTFQPLTGVGEKGGTWKERYEANLNKYMGAKEQFSQEHPIEEMAGEAFGGTMAVAPLGMVGPIARATGLAGTLPQMVTRGMLSQGALSAADAAARGGDPRQIGTSTAIGGGVGGATPFLGPAASAVARSRFGQALAAPFRGAIDPTAEAARKTALAVDRGIRAGEGLGPREYHTARQTGTPVNILDIGGEPAHELARSAGSLSPEARTTIRETLADRFNTQSERMGNAMQAIVHYPDEAAQREALEAAARPRNDEGYRRAYEAGSGAIRLPDTLTSRPSVQRAMRRALTSAQEEAAMAGYGPMNTGSVGFTPDGRLQFGRGPSGIPVYPDLQYWDLTRRILSSEARQAFRAGNDTVGRRFADAANQMNRELDRIVPEYAAARAGPAALFGSRNALDAGRDLASSGTRAAQMPTSQLRRVLDNMAPEQRQLLHDGYVHRIVQQVRSSPDRLNILNKFNQSPAVRERNQLILGPQRANELEAMLRIEAVMDQTRQNIQRYPGAARQLRELGLAAAAGSGFGAYESGWDFIRNPHSAMIALLTYGVARGRTAISQRVANETARLLTSNNLEEVARGLQTTAGNREMMDALRRVSSATVRELTQQRARPHVTITPGKKRPEYGGPME